jgi:hypothetical protein
MPPPPETLTPAYQRFRKSMILDYDKWKEGTPYDLAWPYPDTSFSVPENGTVDLGTVALDVTG